MQARPGRSPQLREVVQEQRRRKHIVMVDSSRAFTEIITELLTDERYGVTASDYAPEFFTQIAVLKPDLIIVDLVITETAGWELLETLELESLTQHIPVIVTSTSQRLLDRALANKERYGFDDYLVKPFDLDVLLAAIEELIGVA
jgi:DNA-binding response OmpR family regulator